MVLRIIWLSLGVLTITASAFGQDVPAVQVAGGYSYLARPDTVLVKAIADEPPDDPSSTEGGTAPRSGWFAEVVGNVTPHAAIVGQASATYTAGTLRSRGWHGDDTAYVLLSGPRFSSRCCGRVVPFAQALLGVVLSKADVTFDPGFRGTFTEKYSAFALGGGTDIRIGGAVGLHLGADGLWTTRAFGWSFRLQTGLVVPMRAK